MLVEAKPAHFSPRGVRGSRSPALLVRPSPEARGSSVRVHAEER